MFDSRVAVSATTATTQIASTNEDDCVGGSDVVASDIASSSSSSDVSATNATMTEGQPSELDQEQEVVGRCLDCNTPFDQFSGTVVCTVCRLPVLVCPSCRVLRCLPGPYTTTYTYRIIIRILP